ncbi:MAG: hypothetical protein JO223_13670 [Hyphomicrobiales bacterium]|nr:hypothetical protein [Hyphomicrobiales bacterium]MBV8441510.1 hypothetical protein [Hyphomicrobiales bacterium]
MNALVSPDHRIRLIGAASVAPIAPELEAVFVGEAAASPAFGAAASAVVAAAALGFSPAEGDTSLNGLPLAFTDVGSFVAAFPDDDSWLARAVRDYFAAGGLRAWVVRVAVDQAAPLDAYVSASPPVLATQPLSAIAIAAQAPSAGLLVLPDLEQACLAAAAPAPPLPSTPPPDMSVFRPAKDFVDPTPSSAATKLQAAQAPTAPIAPFDVLKRVSAALAVLRPDMIGLFALPVGADPTLSQPALAKRAVAYVHGAVAPNPATDLPHVQALAPLVMDASGEIATPSGLVAGLLCAAAQTDGVWRSVAGRSLPLGVTPVRPIESNALAELRKSGIVALRFVQGGTILDDDIMACWQNFPGSAQRRAAGGRRLIGWLIRNLQSFGEQLVFENVLDDGRVELVLTSLFAELFKRGALAGGQVSDAVRITRRELHVPNAYAFDIAVATVSAVETIRLQFLDGVLTSTSGAAA